MAELTDAENCCARYEVVEGHIAVITIDRPHKRNAIDRHLTLALARLADQSERNHDIRCVVLRSSEAGVFCAGADVGEMADGYFERLVTPSGGFAGITHSNRSKPWICAVKGAAYGGGFELVLACDMVVVADDASLGLPEVRRGLLAAGGGVYRLPRLVPRNIALELITTGKPITGARAGELGLANRVVPARDVDAAALSLARDVITCAPIAVSESLTIARAGAAHSDADLQADAIRRLSTLRASSDAAEGMRAFLDKRAPVWTGS